MVLVLFRDWASYDLLLIIAAIAASRGIQQSFAGHSDTLFAYLSRFLFTIIRIRILRQLSCISSTNNPYLTHTFIPPEHDSFFHHTHATL